MQNRPVSPKQQTIQSLGGSGILTDADMAELRAGTQRVAAMMPNGLWYTPEAIRMAAGTDGYPATEGLRRLRELRAIKGVNIEKRRTGGGRRWEYRLIREVVDKDNQGRWWE